MKSVLISINPKWCELIARGSKTIEVRKTRPKLDTPFKCYIYQTLEKRLATIFKKGDEIGYDDGDFFKENVFVRKYCFHEKKVIGEFVCGDITPIEYGNGEYIRPKEYIGSTCLSMKEVVKYGNRQTLYGWHISNLKIYDNSKELSEFNLTRPPQSWGYVEEAKE